MVQFFADIGNSSIKLIGGDARQLTSAPLTLDQIVRIESPSSDTSQSRVDERLSQLPRPESVLVSSVSNPMREIFGLWLERQHPGVVVHQVTADDVPLPTDVESRTRLGIDRLLAAYAATELNRERDSATIVVDCGTAVTIDLVNSSGVFKGGVIFPGSQASLAALKMETAALPDLSDSFTTDAVDSPIGKSTHAAILAGVYQSQAFAVRGIVDRIGASIDSSASVFATGAGLSPIKKLLPTEWHYQPNLVLSGLIRLALHRAQG